MTTEERRNIVVDLKPMLDHTMMFLHIRDAVQIRLVCSTWNDAVEAILDRGPFDCRVPSMSWQEAEAAIAHISAKEVIENSRICESLAIGCVDPVLALLRKRPYNMPLLHRARVWMKGFTGNADCFSPIQRFIASAGLMYSFRSKRGEVATWCIFRLKDPGYFDALERPNEELRKYAELISWNDGTVEPKDFIAAAQNPKCYDLWLQQITHGLEIFKREGWLHPTVPLIVYAMSSMTTYFHLETVEKLLDILINQYKSDVNGCRFSTGATALHEVSGLYGPTNIAIPLAKLLIARGARWDVKTTEKVGDFEAGVSPLSVLKTHLQLDDEKWPKEIVRADVEAWVKEVEASLVSTPPTANNAEEASPASASV